MELRKLKATRAGNRSVVSRKLNRYEGSEECSKEVFLLVYEDLRKKRSLLDNLDEQILSQTAEEEIENEIIETDEYNTELDIRLRRFKEFIDKNFIHAAGEKDSHKSKDECVVLNPLEVNQIPTDHTTVLSYPIPPVHEHVPVPMPYSDSTFQRMGNFHTKALNKELEIREAGTHLDPTEESATVTGIFYKYSESIDEQPQRNCIPRNHQVCCAFCKKSHLSSGCAKYTKHNDRMKIVRRDKLCFNCLGRHLVSECKSKFNCKTCKRRHHTSLCTVHNAVTTKTEITSTLQAKTRKIKNLQDHIENYKSDISKLEQQVKEQKTLTEKTMKDVNFLHNRFAKLQSEYDAQLIVMNQLTAENQAQVTEFKKKEFEVDMLKQEIQRLKSSREMSQRKLQQVGENIHSHVEKQRETPGDRITGTRKESEVSKKQDNVRRNNRKQNYIDEILEKMNIIYRLEKEGNRYTNEANNLTQNYGKDKVHSMQIVDKKISEDDTEIRQQQNMYKSFRDVQGTCSKNLIELQDEITEMKRKMTIMDHQIDLLREQNHAREKCVYQGVLRTLE